MVRNFWGYLKQGNWFGNTQAGTWNVLPAVLTTWSNLLSTQGNTTQYELYKEQAREYQEKAKLNAELIKHKGEIALRNLIIKDKKERGRDIAIAGAKGGNMSGSNLDVIMEKDKMRRMDELTVKADYANQAMLEMLNGYQQAASTYGMLRARAKADKMGVFASILKGLEVYTTLQVRDGRTDSQVKSARAIQDYVTQATFEWLGRNYPGDDRPKLREKAVIEETTDAISLNNSVLNSGQSTSFEPTIIG